MGKHTLRKFLKSEQLKLYETLVEITSLPAEEISTELSSIRHDVEIKLNLVNDIIDICEQRGHY